MGKKVRIQLIPVARDRLEALIANGNTPQKHVRGAWIVALAGDGVGTNEIQRRLGVSKPTIRRWRTRYVEAGVDGLCRDKTRPPGTAPLAAHVVMRVVEKTKTETPSDATHWSLRTMAKAVGISASSVQAIWKAHGLKPHLVATFKLSNDPRFAEKVEDKMRQKAMSPATIREAFKVISAADKVFSSVSKAGKQLMEDITSPLTGESDDDDEAESRTKEPAEDATEPTSDPEDESSG